MPRDEDDIDEIVRLSERIDSLERQIDELVDERDMLLEIGDFQESVRDALGLSWDANAEQLLRVIRARKQY